MKKLRYLICFALAAAVVFPLTMKVLAKSGGTARRPTVTIEKLENPSGRLRDGGGVYCLVDCEGDGPPYEWQGSVASVQACIDQCELTCGGWCEVIGPN